MKTTHDKIKIRKQKKLRPAKKFRKNYLKIGQNTRRMYRNLSEFSEILCMLRFLSRKVAAGEQVGLITNCLPTKSTSHFRF